MATQKLQNYIRTHRKRLGLTQPEVAFLLDCADEQISRHENFNRVPSLETALAYEAIFKVPVRELFAGTFDEKEKSVARRIRRLIEKLDAAEPIHMADRKRHALVVAMLENYSLNKNDDEQKQ